MVFMRDLVMKQRATLSAEYLLSTSCVPGTVVTARERSVNKTV